MQIRSCDYLLLKWIIYRVKAVATCKFKASISCRNEQLVIDHFVKNHFVESHKVDWKISGWSLCRKVPTVWRFGRAPKTSSSSLVVDVLEVDQMGCPGRFGMLPYGILHMAFWHATLWHTTYGYQGLWGARGVGR